MNRAINKNTEGFTLVELLLAMTFISILMLMIAVTVIQISNTYNKGLTLRAVDQAGRDLTTDLRRVIGSSQPFEIDASFKEQGNVSDPTGYEGGRLCTGTFTYVWNFGKALASGNPVNKYDSINNSDISFVRVRDSGGEYCSNLNLDIRKDGATELLSSGDRNLALQNFSISKIADDSSVGQALYRITMEIGTNDQAALQKLTSIDTTCKPPSDAESLQDFCAVNQFDFTAQAGAWGGE